MRIALSLILALGSAAVAHLARESAAERFRETQSYEARYYVPRSDLLPSLTLGYRRAAADLLWMRGLVYFGAELEHAGSVEHAFDYTEAILALDPDFVAPYFWAGVAGLYHPQAIGIEDVERTIAIQRRGLERFPNDGKLMWELAANLRFELAPLLRRSSRSDREAALEAIEEEASELTLQAAARGNAPEFAILSNATALDRLGSRDRAITRLEDLVPVVDDEATRDAILHRLVELRAQQQADGLAADFEALRERWKQERAWIPIELFGLVSERVAR